MNLPPYQCLVDTELHAANRQTYRVTLFKLILQAPLIIQPPLFFTVSTRGCTVLVVSEGEKGVGERLVGKFTKHS